MKTLREYIKEAEENGVAIGHFNISNLEGLHGIYNAAKKLNLPIIIGDRAGNSRGARPSIRRIGQVDIEHCSGGIPGDVIISCRHHPDITKERSGYSKAP